MVSQCMDRLSFQDFWQQLSTFSQMEICPLFQWTWYPLNLGHPLILQPKIFSTNCHPKNTFLGIIIKQTWVGFWVDLLRVDCKPLYLLLIATDILELSHQWKFPLFCYDKCMAPEWNVFSSANNSELGFLDNVFLNVQSSNEECPC